MRSDAEVVRSTLEELAADCLAGFESPWILSAKQEIECGPIESARTFCGQRVVPAAVYRAVSGSKLSACVRLNYGHIAQRGNTPPLDPRRQRELLLLPV